MSKFTAFIKKTILLVLTLAIGMTALPAVNASAAALSDGITPPAAGPDDGRLENLWARLQARYRREGNLLSMADEFIARAQTLIDKANRKGLDTSLVQAALDAFASVIPNAQTVHDRGASIIASHEGFNPNGKVTDRAKAVETIKNLAQVLRDTRTVMNGTGRALRQAIREFRQAHHPAQMPATTAP